MVIMKIPEKPPSSDIKANEIDEIYKYVGIILLQYKKIKLTSKIPFLI